MATTKVFNMAGGKHSAEAYSSFEGLLYGSCVASGLTVTKSSSNMNCSIDSGAGLIKVGSTYARRIAIEGGALTVTVSAASTTLARRDTIVLYVDNSVTPTTSVEDNTNNILKGMVVAGTPAQSPSAPSATTIQNAVGAGNPYIILYDILVPANATNLSTATLYDRRVMASKALIDNLPNGSVTNTMLASNAVTTAKIADNAVTHTKIDWDSMASGTPVSLGLSASGGTFTATHFGYAVIECATQNDKRVVISINGAESVVVKSVSAYFSWTPVVIPVCKGDVIAVTTPDGSTNAQVVPENSKFIPFA